MNLLFNVVYAAHCRSTHHKIAMDSLRKLHGLQGELWSRLFLKHHKDYLKGAKDPDSTFKDFRNHVLHVSQNNWGGAAKTAKMWYDNTIEHLRAQKWREAVYSAGVLSHYYTDPIQPFHTGQSKAENNIHRAAEWSITKSYDELYEIAQQFGWPKVAMESDSDWLEEAVIAGAETSHQYYQPLIDHYDFEKGKSDPPSGLDQYSRETLAELIAYAIVGWSEILQRLFKESGVVPPEVSLSAESVLATIEVPVRWVTKKIADIAERKQIEAMFEEFEETGKVERTLPEDDRCIRDLVAEEINNRKQVDDVAPNPFDEQEEITEEEIMEPVASIEDTTNEAFDHADSEQYEEETDVVEVTEIESDAVSRDEDEEEPDVMEETVELFTESEIDESPSVLMPTEADEEYGVDEYDEDIEETEDACELEESPLRFFLELDADVVDAPSIGPKTAKRFYRIGINTVRQLLYCDVDDAAAKINMRHIPANTIIDWQDQARLVLCIPELRGHDAQILVACDYRTVNDVAHANHAQLTQAAVRFAKSKEGERIIRSGKLPDAKEVGDWINWANQSRSLKAA